MRDKNYQGIPYSTYKVFVDDEMFIPVALQGMYIDISTSCVATISSLPKSALIFQTDPSNSPTTQINDNKSFVENENFSNFLFYFYFIFILFLIYFIFILFLFLFLILILIFLFFIFIYFSCCFKDER